MVFLVRQVQGVFTSSPFRGRWSLLRWILSCGEKVANFCVTRYLSGPKRTAFATSLPLFIAPFVQFTEEQVSQKPDIDEDLPDDHLAVLHTISMFTPTHAISFA